MHAADHTARAGLTATCTGPSSSADRPSVGDRENHLATPRADTIVNHYRPADGKEYRPWASSPDEPVNGDDSTRDPAAAAENSDYLHSQYGSQGLRRRMGAQQGASAQVPTSRCAQARADARSARVNAAARQRAR